MKRLVVFIDVEDTEKLIDDNGGKREDDKDIFFEADEHAMKVMLDKHIPDYVSVNAVMNVEDDIEIRDFR